MLEELSGQPGRERDGQLRMVGLYVDLRFFPEPKEIGQAVRRWEELGIEGIVLGDHLFPPSADYRSQAARRGMDQLTMLAVIATLSQRLRIGAVTANVGFRHPLLLIRAFAQLAVLFGGERVYAGFGAGWSRSEFEAIGLRMPSHRDRLDRLEEALQLARQLFDTGAAEMEGAYLNARHLPLAPTPQTPPRVLVGGGSKRLIELAGRYADHLDLNAPSHRRSMVEPRRKLMTTVDDLEESTRMLRESSLAAGRPADAVRVSVVVTNVALCRESEVEAASERICASVGLPSRSLAKCPFTLIGEPQGMVDAIRERQSRLGLSWIAIPFSDAERFCTEIAPLLS